MKLRDFTLLDTENDTFNVSPLPNYETTFETCVNFP